MKADFLVVVALLLFASHATSVTGESCPNGEDISVCFCEREGKIPNILVKCVSSNPLAIEEALHYYQGKKIKRLTVKELRNVRLPSALFSGLNVETLHITDCDLQRVADVDEEPAFLGLENSLEVLKISRSIKGDNRLETLNLTHLTHLRQLYLEENNIPKIGNDYFRNVPDSLAYISISKCGTNVLGDRAFQSLKNLYSLDLKFNPFETFVRSMLPIPARKLTFLNFESSNLHGLPGDAFSEMPSLKYIYLNSNFITRLPSTTWFILWEELNRLELEGNPLECDSHIEWTFQMKIPNTLLGNCTSPEARKNVSLKELIEKNQNKHSVF